MGRLAGMRFYECGPMDRASDNGVGWRLEVGKFLVEHGCIVLNPCDKPIDIGLERTEDKEYRRRLKAEQKYDELSSMVKTLRIVDLRMVDISDALIVNLDIDIYPAGTAEEIFLANRQKKPILMHCPQGKNAIPDWYFGVFPHQHMFGSWYSLLQYLDDVDTGRDLRHFRRWMFFRQDKMQSTAI